MNTTWIFCCGMRRSASTLQYNIVQGIMEDHDCIDLAWIAPLPPSEFNSAKSRHDGKSEYIITRCHAYTPAITPEADQLLQQGRLRAVHIYRDLRDVIASAFQFRPRNRLYEKRLMSILNEYNGWNSVPPEYLYSSRYEDAVRDLPEEIASIAKFLDILVSDEKTAIIAERYSLESQGEYIAGLFESGELEKRVPDKERLLWYNHISDSELPFGIGRYKEELSKEELGAINDIAGEWQRDHGY